MGGDIWVESVENQGTEFHFTLKVTRVRSDEEVAKVTSPKATVIPKSNLAPHLLRILVAEDNIHNQNLLKVMIGKLGHEVKIVPNGKEALDAYCAEPYDLILMDIRMPDMDGITATRFIRKWEADAKDVPPCGIVALTADAQEGSREQFIKEGMDEYLAKPISLDALGKVIERFACDASLRC